MVKDPTVTALPMELPETMPKRALAKTATLAGPPRALPAIEVARSIKNCPTPVALTKAPKVTNRTMYVAAADMAEP